MAISVTSIGISVMTNTTNIATKTITLSASVPAGSLIVLGVAERQGGSGGSYSGLFGTVADSASNTYTRITQASAVGSSASQMMLSQWYVKNCNGLSSGNTIVYTGNILAMYATGAIYATGIDTTDPLDTTTCATSTSPFASATTSVSVTSGTPTVAGELMVYFVAYRGGVAAPTLDTTHGWTNTPGAIYPNVTGTVTGAMGYQINSGTGTKINTTSWTGSQYSGSSIAGFKEGSAPVVTNSNFLMMF